MYQPAQAWLESQGKLRLLLLDCYWKCEQAKTQTRIQVWQKVWEQISTAVLAFQAA